MVHGTSAVQWADGHSSRAADVTFAAQGSPPTIPSNEIDHDAYIARMVLLFNQIAVLPHPSEHQNSVVFVPAVDDSHAGAWMAPSACDGLSFAAAATA